MSVCDMHHTLIHVKACVPLTSFRWIPWVEGTALFSAPLAAHSAPASSIAAQPLTAK